MASILTTFRGHKNVINAVMEIPKTNTIVTASDDTTMKAWSVEQCRCEKTFNCHDDTAVDMAQLDEHHLLTVSRDKAAKVLRVSDGEVLASVKSLHELLSCVSLTDTVGVVGDEAGNLYKIEWKGSELKEVDSVDEAHSGEIWNMYANGDTIATCSQDGTVKIWNSEHMTLIHTIQSKSGKAVYSVVYDDNYIVTASREGKIFVYDAHSYAEVSMIQTHHRAVESVRIIHDSSIIVSGGEDKFIALHSLPSGDFIAKHDLQMNIHSISILSSGKIAVGGGKPNLLKIVDIDGLLKGKNILPVVTSASTNSENNVQSSLSRGSKRDFVARLQFNKLATSRGKEMLLINEATEAMNLALAEVAVHKKVTMDEFEKLFLETSNDLEISEQSFLQVFKTIISKFDVEIKKEYEGEYKNTFNKFVKDRDATSIPYATRVLQRAYAEMREKGKLHDRALQKEELATALMSAIGMHGSGKVNQEQFVEAALSVLHGVEPKAHEATARDQGSNLCPLS